jgi:hypothetical protein
MKKPQRRRAWGSTLPAPSHPMKRSRTKRKPRSADETLRIYGPPERREWMTMQPSVYSGRTPCVNAHTKNDGKSRKGHYTTIIPLTPDEHDAFDRWLAPFDKRSVRERMIAYAPIIERRWLAHQRAA